MDCELHIPTAPPPGGNVEFQQSRRALELMRCARQEERRCSRVRLTVQAAVVFPSLNAEPETALLRDTNTLGVFFYCKHLPQLGTHVRLNFPLQIQGEPMHAVCEGVVVRVEASEAQAAVGVAVEFSKYEVAHSIHDEVCDASYP